MEWVIDTITPWSIGAASKLRCGQITRSGPGHFSRCKLWVAPRCRVFFRLILSHKDESQPSSSAPNAFIDERVELFDFDRSPFTPERVEEILTRRSLMQDELFIDYVLRNAGIENPTRLFPPSSKETIRETLTAVNDANNPSIKLECIVYYLLSWWKGDSDDNFCENKRIPSGFAELTFAYYLFDSGDYVVRVYF